MYVTRLVLWLTILSTLLSSHAGHAAGFSTARMSNNEVLKSGLPMPMSTSRHFQYIIPNPSPDIRREIDQELLGTTLPMLSWPSFPRTYTQFTDSEYVQTTTSFGLTVNAIAQNLGLGALTTAVNLGVTAKPYNYVYRYTFETSLIIMSSLRSIQPRPGDENLVVEAQNEEMLRDIFYLDPELNRNFATATDEYPMIGYCYLEARVEINTSSEFGISYIIGSSSMDTGRTRTLKHALYSNFFQIEDHVPITDYLDKYCSEHFLKMGRPYVEADFNKLVVEMNIHNNPKNECVIPGVQEPEGDNNCIAWHRSLHPTVQRVTVPRCVPGRTGVSQCVLRSKEGKNCPMYLDRNGNYTEEFHLYRDASIRGYAFQCDDGLSCSFDREPIVWFNQVIFPGSTSCK